MVKKVTNRKLFDDIDDYNGFIDTVGLPYVENFRRTVSVVLCKSSTFNDTLMDSNLFIKELM